jgi:hypothetical protein
MGTRLRTTRQCPKLQRWGRLEPQHKYGDPRPLLFSCRMARVAESASPMSFKTNLGEMASDTVVVLNEVTREVPNRYQISVTRSPALLYRSRRFVGRRPSKISLRRRSISKLLALASDHDQHCTEHYHCGEDINGAITSPSSIAPSVVATTGTTRSIGCFLHSG